MGNVLSILFVILFAMPVMADGIRTMQVQNSVSTMGFVDMAQKLERKDPDWVYWVNMKSIQIVKETFFGGKRLETHYDVDVDGKALSNPTTTNDHMKFSKTFDHLPNREEINQLVDEYHVLVRQSMNEVDWEKQRREQREAEKKEIEEKLRQEFEQRLKEELEEQERRMKEEQEKNKINLGD